MVRGLVMATVALLMAATTVDAGLFSRKNNCGCGAPAVSSCGGCNTCAPRVKYRKVKHRGCCNAAPACGCAAPAPSCCAPAAPVCAAPAPTCCAPRATCCAPAPVACAPASCAAPAAVAPVAPMDGNLGAPPKPAVVDTPAPPK